MSSSSLEDPTELDVEEIPLVDEDEWERELSPYDDDDDDTVQDADPLVMLLEAQRQGAAMRKWVLSQHSWSPSGYCLNFSRTAPLAPGGVYDALAAWNGAEVRKRVSASNVPANVPVFWNRGHGHVAISLGYGLCRSTDWPRRYSVGTARINDISSSWGKSFLGYTHDINGRDCYDPPSAKPKPRVDASNVARATRQRDETYWGKYLKRALVVEVGRGDMNLDSKELGESFRKQYAKFQIMYLRAKRLPVTKDAANGIPGLGSLRWLGSRYGFNVV